MFYALCILERWETCWGLYKALSLARNQAALYGDIGCPPVLDGSRICFPQKFEISINRKHGLVHDYGAVTIKFSMSNTRVDFYVEWTNPEEKKKCEAKMFCFLVRSTIIVHPSLHSRIDRCSWDNCNVWLILQFQMNKTIKITKLVSVDQEPAKIK